MSTWINKYEHRRTQDWLEVQRLQDWGWELVSVVLGDKFGALYYLKRPTGYRVDIEKDGSDIGDGYTEWE